MAALSLRPWAPDHAENGKLSEVLARVSDERGHFRDITEASLQEEIAAEGALKLSESESGEESEDDEDAGDESLPTKARPTSREELFKVKYEMLTNVRAAEQEVLMSLDFVSLLLSKNAPRQAQSTISPVLKDAAPMGSLGIDIWQRMPTDKSRESQDELLATNVRMQGLQQSADSLLAAASRLESNVRKETRYWDQILSISEAGWSVCRIPGDRHRLGVNFGFNESAPQFSRRGLAAFNAGAEGDISLEQGIGTRPRALRVTLRRDKEIVGSSRLPKILDAGESTLEARMRHARDSLFDEELYHEMIRESRDLASLGVGMKGSAIQFGKQNNSDADIQMSFDLCPLEGVRGAPHESSTELDDFAQAIIIAAKLLLGQAHREKLKKRSQIPAPVTANAEEERPVMPILRPVMSFMMHQSALNRLNAYLRSLADMLESAKVRYGVDLAKMSLPSHVEITSSEKLATTLMQPWTSEGKLRIMDPSSKELTLTIQIRTTLAQGFGSRFALTTPSRASPYHADDIGELISAADAKVASLLAGALAENIGSDWTCNENEASLSKDTKSGERMKKILVKVDSEKHMLSLSSGAKKLSWEVDQDSAEQSFWEAGDAILE